MPGHFFPGPRFVRVESRFMARLPTKSPFVLLALGLWIFACSASSAEDDDPNALNQQVKQLIEEGKYPEAVPLAEKAVELAKRVYGPEHPYTATSLNNLGELRQAMGEYPKAEPLLQEALRIRQKVLGPEHPDTALSLNNLGGLYRVMGQYDKAEPLFQEALRIRQKVLGPEHLDTAISFNSLGELYGAMGEYPKAEPLLQEALRIRQKVLGPEHPDTANSLNNLAELYHDMGQYAKAEPLLKEALRIRQKVLGGEHPLTAISLNNLVQYVANGRDLLRELKPSTAKDVVLFANPDFGLVSTPMLAKADNRFSDPDSKSIRGSEKREIEDWRFESLTGTQKERDELIKKFAGWGWTLIDFTAKKATKEALLKIHSPYILHLATHGFFAKEDPTTTQTEPGALLNDRQSVTKSKFFKNPMHRSGLALAGAQTTIEAWKREEVPPVENDGILTAEDVSTLDLEGTWLVTLSACDTGSGEARAGEGVMGLRRGFIQAGAQHLLMTLWPISDELAVQIMSDFYEAAHHSGNAPEALAEVQRHWLVKLRSEKGLAQAVNLAGPFIMSSQGKP
jgi:tetratricopeptide (TPR) repeat protein